MSDAKRILLVGHCLPDRYLLARAIKKASPDVEIQNVNTDEALASGLAGADALLVNRVLDGRFERQSGIELIRSLLANGDAKAAMLISNYEDAQREAEAAGAHPGFGKSELGRESTRDRIRAALGQSSAPLGGE